jgi:hypothetical protein
MGAFTAVKLKPMAMGASQDCLAVLTLMVQILTGAASQSQSVCHCAADALEGISSLQACMHGSGVPTMTNQVDGEHVGKALNFTELM